MPTARRFLLPLGTPTRHELGERTGNGAFCVVQAFLIRAHCTRERAGHEGRTDRQPSRHTLLTTMHTDTVDWSLPGPPSRDLTRHGCRVSAYKDVLAACPVRVHGKGPATKAQIGRSTPDASAPFNSLIEAAGSLSFSAAWMFSSQRRRGAMPHRLRDTPQVRACRLGGGIHAATRSRKRRGHRIWQRGRVLVGTTKPTASI